jgi:predicted RNA-binding Zn-ribbon protein involved in translation (DUF1610 family)
MLEYITTRELENSKGQVKGKVRIIKMKENDFAEVMFVCPECGNSEKTKKKWSSPFVEGSGKNQKFNLKCNKCGYSIKLIKLRKEIKKKK